MTGPSGSRPRGRVTTTKVIIPPTELSTVQSRDYSISNACSYRFGTQRRGHTTVRVIIVPTEISSGQKRAYWDSNEGSYRFGVLKKGKTTVRVIKLNKEKVGVSFCLRNIYIS